MFERLSFDELSRFYGAIAGLEKTYGHENVKEALKVMSDKLDQVKPQARQLELLPFEPEVIQKDLTNRKRAYNGRKRSGENTKIIRDYFTKKNQWPEEEILKMYYNQHKTQEEIGGIIGVTQRAVSRFIHEIPKKSKRRILEKLAGSERVEA